MKPTGPKEVSLYEEPDSIKKSVPRSSLERHVGQGWPPWPNPHVFSSFKVLLFWSRKKNNFSRLLHADFFNYWLGALLIFSENALIGLWKYVCWCRNHSCIESPERLESSSLCEKNHNSHFKTCSNVSAHACQLPFMAFDLGLPLTSTLLTQWVDKAEFSRWATVAYEFPPRTFKVLRQNPWRDPVSLTITWTSHIQHPLEP